jgi:phosphatidylglycerophosphate synthase
MFDGVAKRRLDPILEWIGIRLAALGVGANMITITAFLFGIAAAFSISRGLFVAGLVLIIVSRACDGLDGAVARASKPTDLGGYLDIVLDFAFYGMIPFAFVLYDPAANGVAGALLILSFYVNGASFLAYAILAERHKLGDAARGPKSLYFTTGLAEATETIAVFVAFCLLPDWFSVIAVGFALVCFYTALSRIVLAARIFG